MTTFRLNTTASIRPCIEATSEAMASEEQQVSEQGASSMEEVHLESADGEDVPQPPYDEDFNPFKKEGA